ncbi:hypothetical protein ACX84U_21415, partial [Burkholderia pseudomallei]
MSKPGVSNRRTIQKKPRAVRARASDTHRHRAAHHRGARPPRRPRPIRRRTAAMPRKTHSRRSLHRVIVRLRGFAAAAGGPHARHSGGASLPASVG